MIACRMVMPLLLVAGLLPVGAAHAEVSRMEILSREQPALGGRSFGASGQAEKITARATIALDPTDPRNAVIKDLDAAPRNAQGRVEASTDVVILRPAHPNGTLLFEVVNRGRKLVMSFVEDSDSAGGIRLATAADAGNGFLLDEGFTLVWAGWQADSPAGPDMLRIALPTATGITGPSREEFLLDGKPGPQRVTLSYPAADPASGHLSMAHATQADPRPALDALYPTPAAYVAAVRAASAELVASRLMLPQDAEAEAHMAQDGTLAKLGKLAE